MGCFRAAQQLKGNGIVDIGAESRARPRTLQASLLRLLKWTPVMSTAWQARLVRRVQGDASWSRKVWLVSPGYRYGQTPVLRIVLRFERALNSGREDLRPASELLRSGADLAFAEDDPLLAGEAFEAHRAAGVDLVGGNADLRTESILEAVGKAGRCVDHYRG